MQTERPRKKCGAKTRSGAPCQRWGMANGRCRLHGGVSLSGIHHPNYKTGRYSKHLPSRMLTAFAESMDDPDRLALGAEISLVDARLAELLGRIDTGEAGELWIRLRETWSLLEEAGKQETEESRKLAGRLMGELGRLIRAGATDQLTWNAILETLERRRRLVETERKRLVDMKQLMTAEEGMLLSTALFSAVVKHVTDPNVIEAIGRELAGVIDAGPRGSIPAASGD